MSSAQTKSQRTHSFSRRDFLKLSLAMTALASCSRSSGDGEITTTFAPNTTPQANVNLITPSPLHPFAPSSALAANRLTFGPRQGDVTRIDQMGVDAFIEEQLAYDQLDDSTLQQRLSQQDNLQDTLTQTPSQLLDGKRGEILLDLQQATLLCAVYSSRQLYELMVDFWTNHLNIYFNKNADAYLKPTDDREVIRPHALGKFRDLLGASAHSPAMMMYLDNKDNVKGKPNENYARELMELHTIGVEGGYTQQDVQEVARAFTGWGLVPGNTKKSAAEQPEGAGTFRYAAKRHDSDAKTILGASFPAGGGAKDGERVLDILATHPSAAMFISLKLARRFVSDTPPDSVVAKGAAAFKKSDGDIKATLGAILHSDEFKQSFGQKIKRPFEFVASTLRATNAESDCGKPVLQFMRQMGQPLFLWAAPNGYPDVQGAWLGASTLLARWNFGAALASNALKGTHAHLPSEEGSLDALSTRFFGSALPAPVREALQPFANNPATLGALMVSSPLFQVRG